jgi:hypothetical protein
MPSTISRDAWRALWVDSEVVPESVLAAHPWVEDTPDRSVTELEIEYGILRDQCRPKLALCYFRNPAFVSNVADDD